jgi:hypothetical protein
MFLPKPLGQIDKSPAHNAIEIGNRTPLNGIDQRLPLLIIQKRFTSLRLSRVQTIRTEQIETLNPVTEQGGLLPCVCPNVVSYALRLLWNKIFNVENRNNRALIRSSQK